MEEFIAIIHMLGAAILALVINMFIIFISGVYRISHRINKDKEELSILLNIGQDEVLYSEHQDYIRKYYYDKYSAELFKNRLSDFIGFLKKVWVIIGVITTEIFVALIACYAFPDNLDNALSAWWCLLSPIVIFIPVIIVSSLTKLLIGRSPSAASSARYDVKVFYSYDNISPNWRDIWIFL